MVDRKNCSKRMSGNIAGDARAPTLVALELDDMSCDVHARDGTRDVGR
jgi:hypothetical protein